MKKNLNPLLTITATICLLAVSCAKESFSEEPSTYAPEASSPVTFTATLGSSSTKTYLDGVQVKWQTTDELDLWYGTFGTGMTNAKYTVQSIDANDPRTATFQGLAVESPNYVAVYPLRASNDCSKDGKITTVIPTQQNIKAGSFDEGANTAIAYSDNSTLNFKNVGGLMALQVASTGGHTVSYIRLTGTAALTGEVAIMRAQSGDEYLPAIQAIADGVNYVGVDCGEGIKDTDPYFVSGSNEEYTEEPGDWGDVVTKSGSLSSTKAPAKSGDNIYYMVVLPGIHTGFALTFVDSDGRAAVTKSSHAFTIERNSNTLIANVSLSDADFKTDPQVYINEVDCQNKKIELYNPGSASVDLSGWVLTKDESSWAFPVGSTIAAGGYLVVTCKQSDCSTGPTFGISGDKGFDLKLSNGGLVDRIDNLTSITTIAKGETYGRRTDGADDWVVFSTGTIYESGVCDGDNSKGTVKGDTPVIQSDVVLNEINGTDNGKFVELYNKSSETVNLNGWTLVKDGETVWTGTSSHSVAAGGYLVLYSKKSTIAHEKEDEFSSGISAGKSLQVTIRDASNSSSDTFTRGYSPWNSDMETTCSDSFGRTPDGTGDWKLIDSTPGTANGASKGDIPQN